MSTLVLTWRGRGCSIFIEINIKRQSNTRPLQVGSIQRCTAYMHYAAQQNYFKIWFQKVGIILAQQPRYLGFLNDLIVSIVGLPVISGSLAKDPDGLPLVDLNVDLGELYTRTTRKQKWVLESQFYNFCVWQFMRWDFLFYIFFCLPFFIYFKASPRQRGCR